MLQLTNNSRPYLIWTEDHHNENWHRLLLLLSSLLSIFLTCWIIALLITWGKCSQYKGFSYENSESGRSNKIPRAALLRFDSQIIWCIEKKVISFWINQIQKELSRFLSSVNALQESVWNLNHKIINLSNPLSGGSGVKLWLNNICSTVTCNSSRTLLYQTDCWAVTPLLHLLCNASFLSSGLVADRPAPTINSK